MRLRIWNMLLVDFFSFFTLVLVAWFRGRAYTWPRRTQNIPKGFSGCSCSMHKLSEMRDMYRFHGWMPWSLQRTTDGGYSTLFIVPDDAAN